MLQRSDPCLALHPEVLMMMLVPGCRGRSRVACRPAVEVEEMEVEWSVPP
jgi:hypothetical protein